MKKVIFIVILVLALMEGISWWVYTSFFSQGADEPAKPVEQAQSPVLSSSVANKTEEKPETDQNDVNEEKVVSSIPPASELPSKGMTSDAGNFPPPSTEVKNGVTERMIHMGVRQWAWDPGTIRVKQNELVRLIIHNADVRHALVIPELGVEADIPEDGAVVEFMAKRRGTFEFFCSTYCGEGHMEMRGRIIIE